ncbi:hypothetical protein [Pedobacter namyangjuensis]|uniref:hypothetical protein n=1 Tax=Pedobacter namyangjuensis TaxID=600626 RepID=UPI000DE4624C|nr:hypothetical protein [Pedobacter namyangjuensis]
MKKILLICLLAYLAPAAAQEKIDKLSKSIEDKNFAFVVDNVKTKGSKAGYISVTGPNLYTDANPSTLSPAASERLTSQTNINQLAFTSEKQEYYNRILGDGSYFPPGYLKSNFKSTDSTKSQAVYLIQDDHELKIITTENPKNVKEIYKSSFLAFSNDAYKIKSFKKKKDGYAIVYVLKTGNNTRKLYLNIDNNGKAILQGEPNGQTTTYFYGEILPILKI